MIAIDEIVSSGLCIGCGLCQSISPDSIEIALTEDGVERPAVRSPVPRAELALINSVCPGLRVELGYAEAPLDPMWGPVTRLVKAHATDPAMRFRSATGGVLTALGAHLLESGKVSQILHVAPSEAEPLEWEARLSSTKGELIEGSGSRYGPAAPLTPVMKILDEGTPTALVAKPCDAAAIQNLISQIPGAGDILIYLLVMACGGASRLTKHWDLLEDLGFERSEVVSLRHRGYGNPGPTRVTSSSGRSEQVGYREMWEDESKWDLQWRCKICPDGMGEVADVVALDCWPGGMPIGEDPGFNGVIARTARGTELLESAIEAGAIEVDEEDLEIDSTLETWQPHQSRRKAAVRARMGAMRDQGLPIIETKGLRLDVAEQRITEKERRSEYQGALMRIEAGRGDRP